MKDQKTPYIKLGTSGPNKKEVIKMVDKIQLLISLNELSDIMKAKNEGNLIAMAKALVKFDSDDYRSIENFIDESIGKEESRKLKDLIRGLGLTIKKCAECGKIIGEDDIGRDFGDNLYFCKRCAETC
jgi:histidyl-tRNA synthetase